MIQKDRACQMNGADILPIPVIVKIIFGVLTVGQNVLQAFNAVSDILSPGRHFSQMLTNKYLAILLVFHFSLIFSFYWTLCSLPDISKSLPDMTAIQPRLNRWFLRDRKSSSTSPENGK